MSELVQSPPVTGVMPGGFNTHLQSGGPRFWFLTFILALIIPPAGLILAIYLLAKVIKKSLNNRFLLMALALAITSIIGALIYAKIYSVYYTGKFKHTYSKLETYSLPGKTSDKNGMTFLKPTEFQPSKNSSSSNSAALVHLSSQKNSIGSIVASSNNGSEVSKQVNLDFEDYVTYVNSIFKRPSGSAYDSYTAVFETYLQSVTSKNYEIELDKPSILRNSNITKNAWKFDFSANSMANAEGYKAGEEILNGSLILAFGSNSYYYFVIDTIHENWEPNQDVWQKVFDSLKIDQ